jgi:hypothetical protein
MNTTVQVKQIVPLNNNNTTTESKIETLTPFLQEIMGESE